MKLDNEEQRNALLSFIKSVTIEANWGSARRTVDTWEGLVGAIETAGIDEQEKDVVPEKERDIVPIGDLAPNRLAEIAENGRRLD